MNLFGTIHVAAADCEAVFRCEHDDGEITVDLAQGHDGLRVVLTGTPEQIARLSGTLQGVAETYVINRAMQSLDALDRAISPCANANHGAYLAAGVLCTCSPNYDGAARA